MHRAGLLLALLAGGLTALSGANAQRTYTVDYIVTPQRLLIHALVDNEEKKRKCDAVDAESITPELVQRTGGLLNGWSFVSSANTFGYVTWISEKSGVHTTFIANYIYTNCAISETRREQKTFDGPNRYAEANAEYNRLMLETLGR